MTGREKILNALNHRPGPVPLDLGSLPTTGIHTSILEELRDFYGLEKRPCRVLEPFQMLGQVDDDLREVLGIDTTPLWNRWTMYGFSDEGEKEWRTPWGQTVLVPRDFNVTEDSENVYIYAGGDTRYAPAGVMPKSGFFFDSPLRQKPIVEEELDPLDNLEEFGSVSPEDLDYYRREAVRLQDSPYGVTGNLGGTAIGDIACVPGPMLKDPRGIRDVTEWYVSTLTRPEYLHEVFRGQTDTALANLKKIHQVLGDSIQIAYICGNDFGTQNAPFCSNETFETLYAPYYREINGWIHANTSWKCFKHSCGAIEPLIPLMIESGFDILNPVQWTAEGMDRDLLVKKYGKDLVFWGGGVNTQKTLPFGTPEEVRAEVLATCECFSRENGFVFNTIHNIQCNTPTENLLAMFAALGRKV